MPESLYFYHTNPSLVYELNNGENTIDFKTNQFYINNTSSDVTVVLRNNFPITVSKASGGYGRGKDLTIRTVYQFNSHDRIIKTINAIHEYKKHYNNNQPELEMLLDTLIKMFDGNKDIRNVSISIDRNIDVTSLKEHRCVYAPDNDILLQYGEYDASQPHPFSIEGHAISEYKEFINTRKTSGVFVELVDNENNIKSRYMYVAKNFMEIPVRKDKNRPSGVYFTTAEFDRLDDIHIDPKFYSFEEGESELGLYKTKEEAMSGGNPENISKSEARQNEAAIIEAKQELEKVKTEAKLKEIHRAEELNALKHEQEARQAELKEKIIDLEFILEAKKKQTAELKEEVDARKAKRGDYYEERSHSRKDTSELLKFAPAVLLGAIGVFAYMKKNT